MHFPPPPPPTDRAPRYTVTVYINIKTIGFSTETCFKSFGAVISQVLYAIPDFNTHLCRAADRRPYTGSSTGGGAVKIDYAVGRLLGRAHDQRNLLPFGLLLLSTLTTHPHSITTEP